MAAAKKISSEVRDGVNLITLPSSLVSQMETDLESSVRNWAELPVGLHVLDFSLVVNLDPALYRVFSGFKQTLKTNKKFLASLNVRNPIMSEIRSNGILSVFSPVSNMAGAKSLAGIGKAKLNVAMLEPFVQATLKLMKDQVRLESACGKPYLKKDLDLPVDIAGLIRLQSSDLPGSIAICFPREVFLNIYEKMVGDRFEEINQEIQDAASEILNIIFGQAKTALLEKGIRLEMAIPVVLAGKDVKQRLKENGPAMVLPFTSSVGSFHMEVVLG